MTTPSISAIKEAQSKAKVRYVPVLPVQAPDALLAKFSPDQPRDEQGRWTGSAGAVSVDSPEFKEWFGESRVSHPGGRPKVVYHGTVKNFDSLFDTDRGAIGAHFSDDPKVADKFSANHPSVPVVREGGKVFPTYLSIQNPLPVRDPGYNWNGSTIVAAIVARNQDIGATTEKVWQQYREIEQKHGKQAINAVVRELLENYGYDGIVYLNRYEGDIPYDVRHMGTEEQEKLSDAEYKRLAPKASMAWIALRPEQIKSVWNKGGWSKGEKEISKSEVDDGFCPTQHPDIAKSRLAKDRDFEERHPRDESGKFVPLTGVAFQHKGKIYQGEWDDIHATLFSKLPEMAPDLTDEDYDAIAEGYDTKQGFVDRDGKFHSRADVMQRLGVNQSEDLRASGVLAKALDERELIAKYNELQARDERGRWTEGGGAARTPEFASWFKDSKVVDKDGQPLTVYHGTMAEFSQFKDASNTMTQALGIPTYFFTDSKAVASTYGEKLMPVHLSFQNPLVIDAEGKDWTHAHSEVLDKLRVYRSKQMRALGDYQSEVQAKYPDHEYDELPEQVQLKLAALAEDAESAILNNSLTEGDFGTSHDGIIIRNVWDMTQMSPDEKYTEGGFSPYATVYVALKPEQIKSAENIRPTDDPDIHKSEPIAKRNPANLLESCVMAMLGNRDAKSFLAFGSQLPVESLYTGESGADSYGPDYGVEREPHLTILYGLQTTDPQQVKNLTDKFEPFTAVCGRVACFPAAERDKPYDVLYVPVYSGSARKMNRRLKSLPYQNDYDGWTGHITIAYVKPGEAARYLGDDRFAGKQLRIDTLCLSCPDGSKTMLPLGQPVEKIFDPSQPRDEDGRWTDGGGAGATAPITVPTLPRQFKDWESTIDSKPRTLYRSISPEEYEDFQRTGSLTGKGNQFNEFDTRKGEVFLADRVSEMLLHQGQDASRVAYNNVVERPEYRDYAERQKEVDRMRQAIRDRIEAPNIRRKVEGKLPLQFDEERGTLYAGDHFPAKTSDLKLKNMLANLKDEVNQQRATADSFRKDYNAEYRRLTSQPRQSYVIETKPVVGGRVYGGAFGDGLDEIGFDSGQITREMVKQIYRIDGEKLVPVNRN